MVSCNQSRFPIVLRRPQRRVPRPDKRTKGRRSHPGKHRPCPLALLLTAIAPPALPKAAAPTAPPHFHQWQRKPHHEKTPFHQRQRKPHHEKTLFHQWKHKPHHEKTLFHQQQTNRIMKKRKVKNCAGKALSHDIAANSATAYTKPCKKASHDIAVTSSANRIMKKRLFTSSASRIMKKQKVKTALSKRGHTTLPSAAQRPIQSRVKKHHTTLPSAAAQATS